jgi:hypothetical protein
MAVLHSEIAMSCNKCMYRYYAYYIWGHTYISRDKIQYFVVVRFGDVEIEVLEKNSNNNNNGKEIKQKNYKR